MLYGSVTGSNMEYVNVYIKKFKVNIGKDFPNNPPNNAFCFILYVKNICHPRLNTLRPSLHHRVMERGMMRSQPCHCEVPR